VGKKCVLQLCSQRLDPSACITLYNQLRNLYNDIKKEKKKNRERERESFDRSHDSFKSYKKKKNYFDDLPRATLLKRFHRRASCQTMFIDGYDCSVSRF